MANEQALPYPGETGIVTRPFVSQDLCDEKHKNVDEAIIRIATATENNTKELGKMRWFFVKFAAAVGILQVSVWQLMESLKAGAGG
jgi:hypothetical protein